MNWDVPSDLSSLLSLNNIIVFLRSPLGARHGHLAFDEDLEFGYLLIYKSIYARYLAWIDV